MDVVEISSDEEDYLLPVKRLYHEIGECNDHDEDLIIIEKSQSLPQRRPRKPRKIEAPEVEEEDFECCIVASTKPEHRLFDGVDEDGDELVVTREVGPVACRDFPHARHLCVRLPFESTRHFDCCEQCHCYVCDTLAPCKYWSQHCDASDREDRWLTMRKYKIVQLPLSWTTNPPTRPKTRLPLIQARRVTSSPPPPALAPRSTVAALRPPAVSPVSAATVPRGAVQQTPASGRQTPPSSVGAVRQPTPSSVVGAVRPPIPSFVGAGRPPTPCNSSIQHVSTQVRPFTMADYATRTTRVRYYTTDATPAPPPTGNPTILTGPRSTAATASSVARPANPIAAKASLAVSTAATTPPRFSGTSFKHPNFRTAAAVMQQQENGGSARQPSLASAQLPSPTAVAAGGLSKEIASSLIRSRSCPATATSMNLAVTNNLPVKKRKVFSAAASFPASDGNREQRIVQKKSRRRSSSYSQSSARTPSGQVDMNFGTSVSQAPANQVGCLDEAWGGSQTPRTSASAHDDYLLGLEEFLELNQL